MHALLGENGAGKTTLMRVVFGLLRAQQGVMHWRGAPITMRSPSDALAHGIGMVHQHFTLVPSMTVAENIALGGHGGFDPQQAATRVRDVAARAGLVLDPNARVEDLPVGAQQRCEIVKALARDVIAPPCLAYERQVRAFHAGACQQRRKHTRACGVARCACAIHRLI